MCRFKVYSSFRKSEMSNMESELPLNYCSQFKMHSFNNGEIMDDEWSSFCSSCKSVLQSICSFDESYSSDEMIDELIEGNNIELPIENYRTTMNITDTKNQRINNYVSNNNINEQNFTKTISHTTNNLSTKKRRTDDKNNDKSLFPTDKEIKNINLVNKSGACPSNTYDNIPRKITCINSRNNDSSNFINSEKITDMQSSEQENCYGIVKTKNLIQCLEESNPLVSDSSFAIDLMSSVKSESTAQNILHYRKNILTIAQSILQLSNYMDNMRKMILEGINKRQSDVLSNNNGNKTLASENLPMYCYNSLCTKKK